jgi:hypothetical protein
MSLKIMLHGRLVSRHGRACDIRYLLQRLLGLAGNGQWVQCVPALAGCAAAESAAQKTVGDQIIFVAPRIQPQISPPLGWALSAASINALKHGTGGGSSQPVPTTQPVQCPPGPGRLGDLLQLIPSS